MLRDTAANNPSQLILIPFVILYFNAAHARSNVERALAVMRARAYGPVPAPYLHPSSVERILRGERAVLWGLLWYLRACFGTFNPTPHRHKGKLVHTVSRYQSRGGENDRARHFQAALSEAADDSKNHARNGMRPWYSAEELLMLERSLLSWMWQLGVFEETAMAKSSVGGGGIRIGAAATPRTRHGGVPRDLVEISDSVKNGTLLCRVVGAMQHRPVTGWFRRPTSDKLRRSNIEKGMAVLRVRKDMCQRYLWDETVDRMLEGDRVSVLALFEDCHRCYAGESKRPSAKPSRSEKPFFGHHTPAMMDFEDEARERERQENMRLDGGGKDLGFGLRSTGRMSTNELNAHGMDNLLRSNAKAFDPLAAVDADDGIGIAGEGGVAQLVSSTRDVVLAKQPPSSGVFLVPKTPTTTVMLGENEEGSFSALEKGVDKERAVNLGRSQHITTPHKTTALERNAAMDIIPCPVAVDTPGSALRMPRFMDAPAADGELYSIFIFIFPFHTTHWHIFWTA